MCLEDCDGTLESFTINYGRTGPINGPAFVRLPDGRRALATATATGEALDILATERSPIGRLVTVEVRNGIGHLAFE